MKKRYFVKFLFVVLATLLLLTAGACTSPTFLSGCNDEPDSDVPSTSSKPSSDKQWQDLFSGEFTFTLEQIDGWFYPTVKGSINSDKVPESLTLSCNGEDVEIKIQSIKQVNGYYVLGFNQQVVYDRLDKGEHEAVLQAAFGSTKKTLAFATKLVAENDYIAFTCFDESSQTTVRAMDKVSTFTDADYGFTFQIEKINGWYYPTVRGKIRNNVLPDKLFVECNGKSTALSCSAITQIDDYYVIEFAEQIIYGGLSKGDHVATLTAKFNNLSVPLDYSCTLFADDDYFATTIFDYSSGKSCYAMDKDSNWVGPYSLTSRPTENLTT